MNYVIAIWEQLRSLYKRLRTEAARIWLMRPLMEYEPYCFDFVQFNDYGLEIRGWAIPPQGDHARAGFTLNDKSFDIIDYPLFREDIKRLFWFVSQSELSGFVCRAKTTRDEVFRHQHAVFSYIDRKTGRPLREEHNYYYPNVELDVVPFPPPDNRQRVHGSDSEEAFRLEGYTAFMKLKNTLQTKLGRDYHDFSHILDWGCGCGRTTRYFSGMPELMITGLDIDEDNIRWCQSNLPFGDFKSIPLHPPTALPDETFDLVIGISVFTHLREKEQFEWLAELHRMTMPEAILLVTTLGKASVCRSGLPVSLVRQWLSTGFLDAGENPDLGDAIGEEDYYRNTFHTFDYIKSHWSPYFEIVNLVPGYIGNHQDLIILRRRQ